MTAQPTSTAPPALTATQARALLHALLSTSNPAIRPTFNPAAPKSAAARNSQHSHHQRQPVQAHNITIDASTRIMGHCNSIHLASPSPTEQAARINDLVRGAFASLPKGGAVNVTVNAGVNVMGSKNVVVLGSPVKPAEALAGDHVVDGCTSSSRTEGSGPGRKRKAEDSVESEETAGKKAKLEGAEEEEDA